MKKRYQQVLRSQGRTLTIILAAVIGIAWWQRDFVVHGISANIYLNIALIGGFAIGVAMNYVYLFSLKKEFQALDALREAHDDARGFSAGDESAAEKMRELHSRIQEPAQVLTRPDLLGPAYTLLAPEFSRKGLIAIPNTTKKLLVDEIDEALNQRAVTLNYVAGLMVLLGLLGTFIGLMQTVASVGDIINNLDFSTGAGLEVVQRLITSLRQPLNGMATGFSSSLFGLVASMTIGMMGKVVGRASTVLKLDFENWLAQLAQIESAGVIRPGDAITAVRDKDGVLLLDHDTAHGNGLGSGGGGSGFGSPGSERLLLRVARATVMANARLADNMAALQASQNALKQEVTNMTARMQQLIERMDTSIDNHGDIAHKIDTAIRS